jgi:hypothetical protein
MDWVVANDGTARMLIEAKASSVARLRPAQMRNHPLIDQNRAIASGPRINANVPAQPVVVLRWINGGFAPVVLVLPGDGK